jgi:hypothetical protein
MSKNRTQIVKKQLYLAVLFRRHLIPAIMRLYCQTVLGVWIGGGAQKNRKLYVMSHAAVTANP